jgi:hypothetical protein
MDIKMSTTGDNYNNKLGCSSDQVRRRTVNMGIIFSRAILNPVLHSVASQRIATSSSGPDGRSC